MTGGQWLRDPVLEARGVRHGFGTRGLAPPRGLVTARQVHGTAVLVLRAQEDTRPPSGDFDALVSERPGVAVGVVTADCVPVLLADAGGRRVAAVHAGWRGLTAGVVSAAVEALGRLGASSSGLTAAIGPHAGPCCYEVDGPVIDAVRSRFPAAADAALQGGRPGHAWLDLGALVVAELASLGVAEDAVGRAAAACTMCDPVRFVSYRREGAGAGRLVHFVAAAGPGAPEAGRT